MSDKNEQKIKIRVQKFPSYALLRFLITHPMENGLRHDINNIKIAAHFIEFLDVFLNDSPVLQAQLNTAMAKNPLFTLRLSAINTGDKIRVRWQDNLGETGDHQIIISDGDLNNSEKSPR